VRVEVKDKHLHFAGGDYHLLNLSAQKPTSSQADLVRVRFDFPTQYLVNQRGRRVNTQSVQRNQVVFVVLSWESTAWKVVEILKTGNSPS